MYLQKYNPSIHPIHLRCRNDPLETQRVDDLLAVVVVVVMVFAIADAPPQRL